MFDRELRKLKDIILKPLAGKICREVSPAVITLISFAAGIGAVAAVLKGLYLTALLLWAANRILDGLDGLAARMCSLQSDFGGFLDIFCDFIIYSAVPLSFAAYSGKAEHFAASSVLLASFYINAAVWMSVSALMEKNRIKSDDETSMQMPRGLIEGFETIVFYTLMFIFPQYFIYISLTMAFLVFLGIFIRFIQAVKMLKAFDNKKKRDSL